MVIPRHPVNAYESYMSYKWRGHVFCPRKCQQAIYDAAKKVFEDRFNLKFKKLAGQTAHVPNA